MTTGTSVPGIISPGSGGLSNLCHKEQRRVHLPCIPEMENPLRYDQEWDKKWTETQKQVVTDNPEVP